MPTPSETLRKARLIIQKEVDKALSRENLRLVGELGVKLIKVRTQAGGKGVAVNGQSARRLKPLSNSYVEQRRGSLGFLTNNTNKAVVPFTPRLKPFLSNKTSAKRSNLTRTGQMIDSIKVTRVSNGLLEIAPTGNRRNLDPFPRKNFERSNARVAAFVTEGGRPFLAFSNTDLEQIKRLVRTRFIDSVSKKIDLL